MARNVCLDCGYFLNCKLASEHLTYCERFVKAHRTITKIEDRKENDYGKFRKKITWEFVDGIRVSDYNSYVNMNRFRKSVDDVILENQLNGQKEALIYAIDCNNKQNAQYEKEIRKINEQLMSLEQNKIRTK